MTDFSFSTRQNLERHARRRIVGHVRTLFNDEARGERPVQRSANSLFGPHSMAWRVHGDVAAMMVGGVAALLLQMLHPAVLAGVWDHSNFRQDMIGRLRRTARFIAVTTYGSREEAERAIARVRGIHHHVAGHLPDGSAYRAGDPELLSWVHLAEATSFLAAWQLYGSQPLTPVEQDRYFAEVAVVAEALGAAPVPHTRDEADKLIRERRSALSVGDRTRQVSRLVLGRQAAHPLASPVQALTFQAAVDLLPDWARQMHGLSGSTLARPLVTLGTLGVARTLRWAFAAR